MYYHDRAKMAWPRSLRRKRYGDVSKWTHNTRQIFRPKRRRQPQARKCSLTDEKNMDRGEGKKEWKSTKSLQSQHCEMTSLNKWVKNDENDTLMQRLNESEDKMTIEFTWINHLTIHQFPANILAADSILYLPEFMIWHWMNDDEQMIRRQMRKSEGSESRWCPNKSYVQVQFQLVVHRKQHHGQRECTAMKPDYTHMRFLR